MRFMCCCATAWLVASLPLDLAAQTAPAPVNVIVYKEDGKFGGWPANHGIWAWGDEIVLGHRVGTFKVNGPNQHAIDGSKPQFDWQARSLDGGMTWKEEQPPALARPENDGPKETQLTTPINFTDPNFAFMVRYPSGKTSRFYYSTDRAKTWNGPYLLPTFDQPWIKGRTDYLINGPHDATLFVTAGKKNEREGRIITVRTTDGGLTWKFVAFIGPEPKGFSIMSSSARLSDSKILTTIRRQEPRNAETNTPTTHFIDAYLSTDNGSTFNFLNKPTDSTGGSVGNPPALVRMRDGRLAISYGYRSAPFGMRARVSKDEGQTWSKEIILRDDAGCWDLGYPKSVQLPDGRIFVAYYYNDGLEKERYIAATIWSADLAKY
jgi:hypothetical protein